MEVIILKKVLGLFLAIIMLMGSLSSVVSAAAPTSNIQFIAPTNDQTEKAITIVKQSDAYNHKEGIKITPDNVAVKIFKDSPNIATVTIRSEKKMEKTLKTAVFVVDFSSDVVIQWTFSELSYHDGDDYVKYSLTTNDQKTKEIQITNRGTIVEDNEELTIDKFKKKHSKKTKSSEDEVQVATFCYYTTQAICGYIVGTELVTLCVPVDWIPFINVICNVMAVAATVYTCDYVTATNCS
jgi:hypothetical protein